MLSFTIDVGTLNAYEQSRLCKAISAAAVLQGLSGAATQGPGSIVIDLHGDAGKVLAFEAAIKCWVDNL